MIYRVSIRPAERTDAPVIRALSLECFGSSPPDAAIISRVLSATKNVGELALCALAGGNVAGYCHAQIVEPLYSERQLYIHALCVSAAYRRRGIGARLIERAEEWGRRRGASAVSLHSGFDRLSAHAFYRSLGYVHKNEQMNFTKPLV